MGACQTLGSPASCWGMKNRIGVVVLILVAIGLGVALITIKNKAGTKERQDEVTINTFSNRWVKTQSDLEEQRQVSAMLEKDIDTQKKSFNELSNTFTQVSANLSKTEASLETTE